MAKQLIMDGLSEILIDRINELRQEIDIVKDELIGVATADFGGGGGTDEIGGDNGIISIAGKRITGLNTYADRPNVVINRATLTAEETAEPIPSICPDHEIWYVKSEKQGTYIFPGM